MTAKRELPAARDKVREWLRRGDPLSQGMPPDEEIRQLRARVLLAADRPTPASHRHPAGLTALPAWRPAIVVAAVALLALSAMSVVWITRSPSAAIPKQASYQRPAPSPEVSQPPVLEPVHAPSANEIETQSGRNLARTARYVRSASRPSRTAANRDVPEHRPLQVQFTTPGGTRIVWVLNPDLPLR